MAQIYHHKTRRVEQLGFFLPEEVLEWISREETHAFFKKHVVIRHAEENGTDGG
jgi:hypothetical protein